MSEKQFEYHFVITIQEVRAKDDNRTAQIDPAMLGTYQGTVTGPDAKTIFEDRYAWACEQMGLDKKTGCVIFWFLQKNEL